MNIQRWSPFRTLVLSGAFLISHPTLAAPSIWWDHLAAKPGESQAECVRRASALIPDEKARHVTVDSDSVRVWSEKSVAVIECIRFGESLATAILVTSEDSRDGEQFFAMLREGLMIQPPKPS